MHSHQKSSAARAHSCSHLPVRARLEQSGGQEVCCCLSCDMRYGELMMESSRHHLCCPDCTLWSSGPVCWKECAPGAAGLLSCKTVLANLHRLVLVTLGLGTDPPKSRNEGRVLVGFPREPAQVHQGSVALWVPPGWCQGNYSLLVLLCAPWLQARVRDSHHHHLKC